MHCNGSYIRRQWVILLFIIIFVTLQKIVLFPFFISFPTRHYKYLSRAISNQNYEKGNLKKHLTLWRKKPIHPSHPSWSLYSGSSDFFNAYISRTRTDSGSGTTTTSRLQRTGSSNGMRTETSSMSRTTSSRFGSSSALRSAVESTRGYQQ